MKYKINGLKSITQSNNYDYSTQISNLNKVGNNIVQTISSSVYFGYNWYNNNKDNTSNAIANLINAVNKNQINLNNTNESLNNLISVIKERMENYIFGTTTVPVYQLIEIGLQGAEDLTFFIQGGILKDWATSLKALGIGFSKYVINEFSKLGIYDEILNLPQYKSMLSVINAIYGVVNSLSCVKQVVDKVQSTTMKVYSIYEQIANFAASWCTGGTSTAEGILDIFRECIHFVEQLLITTAPYIKQTFLNRQVKVPTILLKTTQGIVNGLTDSTILDSYIENIVVNNNVDTTQNIDLINGVNSLYGKNFRTTYTSENLLEEILKSSKQSLLNVAEIIYSNNYTELNKITSTLSSEEIINYSKSYLEDENTKKQSVVILNYIFETMMDYLKNDGLEVDHILKKVGDNKLFLRYRYKEISEETNTLLNIIKYLYGDEYLTLNEKDPIVDYENIINTTLYTRDVALTNFKDIYYTFENSKYLLSELFDYSLLNSYLNNLYSDYNQYNNISVYSIKDIQSIDDYKFIYSYSGLLQGQYSYPIDYTEQETEETKNITIYINSWVNSTLDLMNIENVSNNLCSTPRINKFGVLINAYNLFNAGSLNVNERELPEVNLKDEYKNKYNKLIVPYFIDYTNSKNIFKTKYYNGKYTLYDINKKIYHFKVNKLTLDDFYKTYEDKINLTTDDIYKRAYNFLNSNIDTHKEFKTEEEIKLWINNNDFYNIFVQYSQLNHISKENRHGQTFYYFLQIIYTGKPSTISSSHNYLTKAVNGREEITEIDKRYYNAVQEATCYGDEQKYYIISNKDILNNNFFYNRRLTAFRDYLIHKDGSKTGTLGFRFGIESGNNFITARNSKVVNIDNLSLLDLWDDYTYYLHRRYAYGDFYNTNYYIGEINKADIDTELINNNLSQKSNFGITLQCINSFTNSFMSISGEKTQTNTIKYKNDITSNYLNTYTEDFTSNQIPIMRGIYVGDCSNVDNNKDLTYQMINFNMLTPFTLFCTRDFKPIESKEDDYNIRTLTYTSKKGTDGTINLRIGKFEDVNVENLNTIIWYPYCDNDEIDIDKEVWIITTTPFNVRKDVLSENIYYIATNYSNQGKEKAQELFNPYFFLRNKDTEESYIYELNNFYFIDFTFSTYYDVFIKATNTSGLTSSEKITINRDGTYKGADKSFCLEIVDKYNEFWSKPTYIYVLKKPSKIENIFKLPIRINGNEIITSSIDKRLNTNNSIYNYTTLINALPPDDEAEPPKSTDPIYNFTDIANFYNNYLTYTINDEVKEVKGLIVDTLQYIINQNIGDIITNTPPLIKITNTDKSKIYKELDLSYLSFNNESECFINSNSKIEDITDYFITTYSNDNVELKYKLLVDKVNLYNINNTDNDFLKAQFITSSLLSDFKNKTVNIPRLVSALMLFNCNFNFSISKLDDEFKRVYYNSKTGETLNYEKSPYEIINNNTELIPYQNSICLPYDLNFSYLNSVDNFNKCFSQSKIYHNCSLIFVDTEGKIYQFYCLDDVINYLLDKESGNFKTEEIKKIYCTIPQSYTDSEISYDYYSIIEKTLKYIVDDRANIKTLLYEFITSLINKNIELQNTLLNTEIELSKEDFIYFEYLDEVENIRQYKIDYSKVSPDVDTQKYKELVNTYNTTTENIILNKLYIADFYTLIYNYLDDDGAWVKLTSLPSVDTTKGTISYYQDYYDKIRENLKYLILYKILTEDSNIINYVYKEKLEKPLYISNLSIKKLQKLLDEKLNLLIEERANLISTRFENDLGNAFKLNNEFKLIQNEYTELYKNKMYNNYIEVVPIKEFEQLVYKQGRDGKGHFYDKTLLERIKNKIGKNCILTCTECTEIDVCPFYKPNEIILDKVEEEKYFTIYVKDNILNLIDTNINDYIGLHSPTEEYIDKLAKFIKPYSLTDNGRNINSLVNEIKQEENGENLTPYYGYILKSYFGTIGDTLDDTLTSKYLVDTINFPYNFENGKVNYECVNCVDDDKNNWNSTYFLYSKNGTYTTLDLNNSIGGQVISYSATAFKPFYNRDKDYEVCLVSDDVLEDDEKPIIYIGNISDIEYIINKTTESFIPLSYKEELQRCLNISIYNHTPNYNCFYQTEYYTNGEYKTCRKSYNEDIIISSILSSDLLTDDLINNKYPYIKSFTSYLKGISLDLTKFKWTNKSKKLTDIEKEKYKLTQMKTNLRLVLCKK